MEPDIRKGSLVLADTAARFDDLEEEDVISFRGNNTEALHRVSKITEDELVITPDKGAGSAVVNKSMYVGKEVIAFPIIGGWLRGILEHGVWAVVVLAGTLVVIGCLPWKVEMLGSLSRLRKHQGLISIPG